MEYPQEFMAGAVVLHVEDDGGHVAISGECAFLKTPFTVMVVKDDYERWRETDCHVQDAFPYMPADQREFLISGISPEGWEQFVNEAEENEGP
jgi:hypothetical protein